jgi:hypothetical protein
LAAFCPASTWIVPSQFVDESIHDSTSFVAVPRAIRVHPRPVKTC